MLLLVTWEPRAAASPFGVSGFIGQAAEARTQASKGFSFNYLGPTLLFLPLEL